MLSDAANKGLRAAEHADPSWRTVDHVMYLQFINEPMERDRDKREKYEPISAAEADDESEAGSAAEPFDVARQLDYKRKPQKRPATRDQTPKKPKKSWEDGTLLLRYIVLLARTGLGASGFQSSPRLPSQETTTSS